MNDGISSGFMVIQSNLVENLRDLLTTWTTKTPLTPLEDEIILVQSNGIAQWLRLALANHSSSKIAAGLQTPLPSAFVWQMYRAVLPNLPKISAYDKNPLAWRIFTLLQDKNRLLQEMGEQAKDLLLFLCRTKRQLQLWQFAYTIADTFDQYQVYRADWLNDWNKGKEELRGFNNLNKKSRTVATTYKRHCRPIGTFICSSPFFGNNQFFATTPDNNSSPHLCFWHHLFADTNFRSLTCSFKIFTGTVFCP